MRDFPVFSDIRSLHLCTNEFTTYGVMSFVIDLLDKYELAYTVYWYSFNQSQPQSVVC
jgi:hypothetical protein